jgi:hypothetical protein
MIMSMIIGCYREDVKIFSLCALFFVPLTFAQTNLYGFMTSRDILSTSSNIDLHNNCSSNITALRDKLSS